MIFFRQITTYKLLTYNMYNVNNEKNLTRIDQILIGDTGMIHVVDGGGEEGREDLQRREHRLQVGGLKENMGWLGNVGCVTMIMVGNVFDIVIF